MKKRKKNIFYTIGMLFLYGVSFLSIRFKHKWVFGSNLGYSNNAKYLFIYISENCPEKPIWIGSKEEVAFVRKQGYRANYRWGIKGIYHCLTAKAYVFNSYVGDINVYASGRSKRINLWHGVGIKNIERSVNSGALSEIFQTKQIIRKFHNLAHLLRPHFFLSTSPLMTTHFCKCFDISKEVCYEGCYPRCEIFNWTDNKLIDFIKNSEGEKSIEIINRIQNASETYLYMPTWRDGNQDFIKDSNLNFELLNNVLNKDNKIFIIKFHPITFEHLNLKNKHSFSNIIFIDSDIDIYPILPFTDVLITDYSSIYYDYLLLKQKKIILYIFDYDEFIANSRDFAFNFDDYMIAQKVRKFEDLLNIISGKLPLVEYNLEKEYIKNLFWDTNSDKNMKMLYRSIKSVIVNNKI